MIHQHLHALCFVYFFKRVKHWVQEMRLLPSVTYWLVKGVFPCLKWPSTWFWLCFVVMDPAGKSFLMAQLWVNQHNMFSVEDLLISHGYKLSKNAPVSYESRYDGYRHEITGNRSAQRPALNGIEAESRAGAYSKKPLVKTSSSSTESSHGSQGRQAGPGYHHDLQGLSTFRTSEGG